ncbi:MAG: hypothetical protein RL077_1881, partial [Verrucomicrobiota bacterium]
MLDHEYADRVSAAEHSLHLPLAKATRRSAGRTTPAEGPAPDPFDHSSFAPRFISFLNHPKTTTGATRGRRKHSRVTNPTSVGFDSRVNLPPER